MTTLAVELEIPMARSVLVTDDTLNVDLNDGRSLSVPLPWFPRLYHASKAERNNWRFIGQGHGIHWEDIDEDISVANFILGNGSGESQQSLQKWLEARKR